MSRLVQKPLMIDTANVIANLAGHTTEEIGAFFLEWFREWNELHPPRLVKYRVAIPKAVKEAVFERDGFQCSYCDALDGPFELDHIHPVSRGGSNGAENLCVACLPCNRSKRDKLLSEWRPQ